MDYAEFIKAYKHLTEFYGEKTSKRAGIPLKLHIDQGILIINARKASDKVVAAYTLHPLFQDDASLALNFSKLLEFDSFTTMLVMEYRNIANQGLRNRTNPMRLNIPIKGVAEMLIADKVQNRYSFEKYREELNFLPDDADLLDAYFKAWLEKLDISENLYRAYVELIEHNTA